MTKKDYINILIYFSLSAALTLAISAAISRSFPGVHISSNPYNGEAGLLNAFTSNDSEWYLHIAKKGYTDKFIYAFYPLYPILICALSHIGIPPAAAGVFISWSAFLLAGLVLYRLLPYENRKAGMLLFFFSPISIYCFSIYTESLFLLLTLLCWYLFIKKKYLLCGITLGLSMLTRNSAYIFAFILLIDYMIKHRKCFITNVIKHTRALFRVFVPAALLGSLYPIFTYIKINDFFMFLNVQFLYWRKIRTLPWEPVIKDILYLFTYSYNSHSLSIIFNLLSLGVAVFLSVRSIIKRDFALSLLLLLTVSVCLSVTSDIPGMPAAFSLFRYLWGCFPIYILLSKAIKPKAFYIYISYIPLMIISTAMVIMKALFA